MLKSVSFSPPTDGGEEDPLVLLLAPPLLPPPNDDDEEAEGDEEEVVAEEDAEGNRPAASGARPEMPAPKLAVALLRPLRTSIAKLLWF